MMQRTEEENNDRLKGAQSLPPLERQNLRAELNHDFWEWIEWLNSIEDRELVKKAKTIDVDLDEIPLPEPDQFQQPSLWKFSEFGFEVLYDECRHAIKKAVRERMPAYRREQREGFDMYIKGSTLLIGLIGMVIALVTALKK